MLLPSHSAREKLSPQRQPSRATAFSLMGWKENQYQLPRLRKGALSHLLLGSGGPWPPPPILTMAYSQPDHHMSGHSFAASSIVMTGDQHLRITVSPTTAPLLHIYPDTKNNEWMHLREARQELLSLQAPLESCSVHSIDSQESPANTWHPKKRRDS